MEKERDTKAVGVIEQQMESYTGAKKYRGRRGERLSPTRGREMNTACESWGPRGREGQRHERQRRTKTIRQR